MARVQAASAPNPDHRSWLQRGATFLPASKDVPCGGPPSQSPSRPPSSSHSGLRGVSMTMLDAVSPLIALAHEARGPEPVSPRLERGGGRGRSPATAPHRRRGARRRARAILAPARCAEVGFALEGLPRAATLAALLRAGHVCAMLWCSSIRSCIADDALEEVEKLFEQGPEG